LPRGDAALVLVRFDYSSDADVALDELISRIVICMDDSNGNEFSTASIDPA